MIERLILPAGAALGAASATLLAIRGLAGEDLRSRFEELGRWMALLLGFVAGVVVLADWPALPPHDSVMWVPWLGALGAAVGLALRRRPWWTSALAAGALSTGGAWLILKVLVPHAWTPAQLVLGVAITSVVITATWLLAAAASRRTRGSQVLVATIPMTAVAGAILLSGTVLLGLMAAVLAAAILAVELLSIRSPQPGIPERSAGLIAIVTGCLLAGAHAFASLPLLSAVVLALAPLSAASILVTSRARWAQPVAWVALLGLSALGVGIAWDVSPSFDGVW